MDEALDRAAAHVGDNPVIMQSGSGAVQFMTVTTDAAGQEIRKIARFDVNMMNGDVFKQGPHLNLETRINGIRIKKGPLADPHTPIDPATIRPGDDWPKEK